MMRGAEFSFLLEGAGGFFSFAVGVVGVDRVALVGVFEEEGCA